MVKARTVAEANAGLDRFRPEYNRRFGLAAADATLAWRAVRRGTDLDRVCSLEYAATVLSDNTVRLGGTLIDVPPGPRKRSYARSRVGGHQLLDGSWRVYLGDEVIATKAATTTAELRTIKHRRRRPPSAAWSVSGQATERMTAHGSRL